MRGTGKRSRWCATSAGKQISTEQSGEVPGTWKQPESVKRVKNVQNPQFHRVGRHMAYQCTKHIVAKHNVDQDVDVLGPQESSLPSTPPNHTLLSDITVDLNPPYFDFDLESSRNSSPGPKPEPKPDPPHLTCIYHPKLNGKSSFYCVIRILIQLYFGSADLWCAWQSYTP